MTPPSRQLWDRIPFAFRKPLVWSIWLVTWIGLLAGLLDPVFYVAVVWLSAAHALLFWVLLGYRARPFPVQVRLAYLAWVAAGTWIPGLQILLYITTIGLATNLFLGYCPLARMMFLLPWNRTEPFSGDLVLRTFLTAPVKGPFRPKPAETPHAPPGKRN